MANEMNLAGRGAEVNHAASDLERALESDDIQFEARQVDSPTFGEGHEPRLKQISDEISRQLKELDKRWVARWAPQDLALKNHERRIKALESRRPR